MHFFQESFSEEEVTAFVEAVESSSSPLKLQIIDPMISILEDPKHRKEYIKFGDEFLDANAEMLSKEYPSKPVSFPRMYVDNLFNLFGFDKNEFKKTLKSILMEVSDKTSFATITANPTNVLHSIVLIYSDMTLNTKLRDSARQQMGISVYNNLFNHFFHPPHPIDSTMAYVYMNLDNSWGLVKSENVMNWITGTLETAYAFWRTRLTLNMSPTVLVQFLNRVRTSFQQNLRMLANRYYDNMNNGNLIGSDVNSNESNFVSNSTIRYRQNLVRRIKTKDPLYTEKSNLYSGIAKIKNVKTDSLYNFAQTIEVKDIERIIDTIFYVFIVKEEHTIDEINSTAYIGRITNLPVAVDRAVAGQPIILPLSKKYKFDQSIVKAYICLLATYIMYRINDIK